MFTQNKIKKIHPNTDRFEHPDVFFLINYIFFFCFGTIKKNKKYESEVFTDHFNFHANDHKIQS